MVYDMLTGAIKKKQKENKKNKKSNFQIGMIPLNGILNYIRPIFRLVQIYPFVIIL